jgi:hypothetical protein
MYDWPQRVEHECLLIITQTTENHPRFVFETKSTHIPVYEAFSFY